MKEFVEQDTSDIGGYGSSIVITNCGLILSDIHLGDSIAVNGKFILTLASFDYIRVALGLETNVIASYRYLRDRYRLQFNRF